MARLSKAKTLPLGIDIGSTNVRVALVVREEHGRVRLRRAVTRGHDGEPLSALNAALHELDTHERRCVLGIGAPLAQLRDVIFPPMPRAELMRAVRFEAQRLIDYPLEEATVRLSPVGERGTYALGIARTDSLRRIAAIARRAKLRVVAIDDMALALRRALDADDPGTAIIDIGVATTAIYTYARPVPSATSIAWGGAAFTTAIAASLGLDPHGAEHRKRTLGIGGSATSHMQRYVDRLAASLAALRAQACAVHTVSLVGNGARLDGLSQALALHTAANVAIAELPAAVSTTIPPDVVRAASPDWCGAYGLALWNTAR